jgi:hypothetical protein
LVFLACSIAISQVASCLWGLIGRLICHGRSAIEAKRASNSDCRIEAHHRAFG